MYPFSIPLKTSEKQGVEEGCIGNKWVRLRGQESLILFLGLIGIGFKLKSLKRSNL